jgi:hypothetical protein
MPPYATNRRRSDAETDFSSRRHDGLRILFLPVEFPIWRQARSFAYSAQFAFLEGFAANGAAVTTVASLWWNVARDILRGQTFDQVWLHPLYSPADEAFREWVATIAPVRVALVTESLTYTEPELARYPQFAKHSAMFENWLPYLTHVLAVDEMDIDAVRDRGVRGMWWVTAVPARLICDEPGEPRLNRATFIGALYGNRKMWLKHPRLESLLVRQPSPERFTFIPAAFGGIGLSSKACSLLGLDFVLRAAMPRGVRAIRAMRRHSFARYLRHVRDGAAIVNLPAYVKAYAGRVIEGMAAGRPVISWSVPDRPRNAALFRDGEEILLYSGDDPVQLASQIERVLAEPDFRRWMTANARAKVLRLHTTEKRVSEVLEWIRGEEPPDDY